VLKRSSLGAETGAVRLSVRAGEEALVGDAVKRRLQRLAETLDRKVEVTTA
jgi:predicted transcriptional regulator